MEKGKVVVIVGLGKTGISCARYLESLGRDFIVLDDNPGQERLIELEKIRPSSFGGRITEEKLLSAGQLILSPGIPLARKEIKAAIAANVSVTGDIEIFSHATRSAVIAITGSNGKSTVTSLVNHILKCCGKDSVMGGNIGIPCLDLLSSNSEYCVLEVSSFQLDTTGNLPCEVAVVLNLSPDHMDRYDSLENYYTSKAGIYRSCKVAVINRDVGYEFLSYDARIITFGSDSSAEADSWGMIDDDGLYLSKGNKKLVETDSLKIKGRHNALNALAALAIGNALGLEDEPMLKAVQSFPGLPHRCEWLGEIKGLHFFNDSKSTNPGSTIAAVEGLGSERKNIILLLGGKSKSADFTKLNDSIEKYVDKVLVFGEDANKISEALTIETIRCADLKDMIDTAVRLGEDGDIVLLSPACASFDMFSGYEERGNRFKDLVRRLAA